MRAIPIFDTNVFGHLEDGTISEKSWRYLLERRPAHGWPLSNVTALELLSGLHDIPDERFPNLRRQIELSFSISRVRILEEARFLICSKLLRSPFPTHLVPPFANVIVRYLEIVRRAKSCAEILKTQVLYKGLRTGFRETAVLRDLLDGPRNQWKERIEAIATENYAEWRELFVETGRRLPREMRQALEPPSAWNVHRERHAQTMLEWLKVPADATTVTDMAQRLDATFEFSTFVAREFLMRDYSLEKHSSDVFDFFQLHYLAMDEYVIVSEDSDLTKRTSSSSQAHRLMCFDDFLTTI